VRDVVVVTKNLRAFLAAMERLGKKRLTRERMALVFGEPGLGKTEAMEWYCVQQGPDKAVAIRMDEIVTPRVFLQRLAVELGLKNLPYSTAAIFDMVITELRRQPRHIFVDEVDKLDRNKRLIETLRDIHDNAITPVILLGEEMADKKFARYPRLYDRFTEIVRFKPLGETDVRQVCAQLSPVKFTQDAVVYITQQSRGKMRPILAWIERGEELAEANGLKAIDAKALKSLNGNGRR